MTSPDCLFCYPNWKNLDIIERSRGGSIAVLRPTDPVTDGHVLIIHARHANDATDQPSQAAGLIEYAARYIRQHRLGAANLITSIVD